MTGKTHIRFRSGQVFLRDITIYHRFIDPAHWFDRVGPTCMRFFEVPNLSLFEVGPCGIARAGTCLSKHATIPSKSGHTRRKIFPIQIPI